MLNDPVDEDDQSWLDLPPEEALQDMEGEIPTNISAPTTIAAALNPSPTPPTTKELEELVVSDLNRLSLKEREEVLSDIHAIPENSVEKPAMVEKCLKQLENRLTKIKFGTAYEEAEQMNQLYCRNRDLRLMFLRAERYDTEEAAERLLRFFDLKKSLFGNAKLTKDITLDDLDENDIANLRAGTYQLGSSVDSAGRTIHLQIYKLRRSIGSKESDLRAAFFNSMKALSENPDAQIKGVVSIFWLLDCGVIKSIGGKLRNALPIKVGGIHCFYNELSAYKEACVAAYLLPRKSRVRVRFHYGSAGECLAYLKSFGIPNEALPIREDGAVDVDTHRKLIDKWIRGEPSQGLDSTPSKPHVIPPFPVSSSTQWEEDSESTTSSPPSSKRKVSCPSPSATVFEPEDNDILFGRGRGLVDHDGNIRFRAVVEYYATQYEKASRTEKTVLAELIVGRLRAQGRFLKRTNGADTWEVVDDALARKKVAHAFRNRRKFG